MAPVTDFYTVAQQYVQQQLILLFPHWTCRTSWKPVENGLLYGMVGLEVSAVLHPACPPKNARCHQWTSFHVSETNKQKKANVVFSHYSKVSFEKHASLLGNETNLKMVLSMIFLIKGNLFFFSFVRWSEKHDNHFILLVVSPSNKRRKFYCVHAWIWC